MLKLQRQRLYVNFLSAVISGNGQSKFSIVLALHLFAVKCWTDVSDSSCNLFRRKPASANLPLVESNKMSLEPVPCIWFAWGYCLAFLTVLPNKSRKIWIHFELKWNKTGGKTLKNKQTNKNQKQTSKQKKPKKPKSTLWRLLDIFLSDMKSAIYKTKQFKNT